MRAALKLSNYFCIVSELFGFSGLFLIRRVTNWVELTFAFRVGQSLWVGKREVGFGFIFHFQLVRRSDLQYPGI